MSYAIMETHREIMAGLTAPGGPFETVEIEVRGHMVRAFARSAVNLIEMIDRAEELFADQTFLVVEGREYSFGEACSSARRLAAALQDCYGIKAGDRVGICMANRYEYFLTLFAIARIGAIAVLFNSRGAVDEVAAAVEDLDCTLIIADDRRAALIRRNNGTTPLIVAGHDAAEAMPANATVIEDLIAPGARSADVTTVDAEAPCWVLFTSGTSGRPKGAVLTQRNICNMFTGIDMLTNAAIERVARTYGMPADQLRTMMPPQTTLLIMPLFHISGLTQLTSSLLMGAKIALMSRWNAAVAADLIETHKVASISGPPLVMLDLLDLPDATTRLASITNIAIGGQATPQDLSARCYAVLPNSGQGGGWGMTEAAGSVCTFTAEMYGWKPTSVGPLHPIMDLRTVDDDGNVLPEGEAGEIHLRGALVMEGYWNQPDATAAVFDGNWYRTGDVGFIDEDGLVHVIDRKKDMVIVSGENIYCAEVERVLESSGHFLEQVMFGVPDDRTGERAIVAVVPRSGVILSEADVKAITRASLADYKVPAEVRFDLGPFPRNATGKIVKAKVRAAYLEKVTENA